MPANPTYKARVGYCKDDEIDAQQDNRRDI
jgi:hypothetical protein